MFENILRYRNVPLQAVNDKTTIGDIGDMAVYTERLRLLGNRLRPQAQLNIINTPDDAFPTYALSRQLEAQQRKADRVAGSDLGDSQIAPLALYADFLEVDKRTLHHIARIRKHGEFNSLLPILKRAADYSLIAEHFAS